MALESIRKRLKRNYLKSKALYHLEAPLGWYYRQLNPTFQDIRDKLPRKNRKNLRIPKYITIEVSNICNARCVFCAYRKVKLESTIMKMNMYRKTIDQCAEIGIEKVIFSPTIGENLTDPKFFEKVWYAKKKGLIVQVCTNGILLMKNENYKKMVDYGVDRLGISTGDFDYKWEAKILGISESAAKEKLAGIINLLKYREKTKSNMDVTISLRSARSFKEIWKQINSSKDLKRYIEDEDCHLCFLLRFDNWAGSVTQKDLIGNMRLGKVRSNRRHVCTYLNDLSVLPTGNVRLCGCRIKHSENDELVIGNINKSSLKTIIEKADMEGFCKSFKNHNPPEVCQNCVSYCT